MLLSTNKIQCLSRISQISTHCSNIYPIQSHFILILPHISLSTLFVHSNEPGTLPHQISHPLTTTYGPTTDNLPYFVSILGNALLCQSLSGITTTFETVISLNPTGIHLPTLPNTLLHQRQIRKPLFPLSTTKTSPSPPPSTTRTVKYYDPSPQTKPLQSPNSSKPRPKCRNLTCHPPICSSSTSLENVCPFHLRIHQIRFSSRPFPQAVASYYFS